MIKQGYFVGNKPLSYTNLDHLQEQAKEMEKEQIMLAWIATDNELQRIAAEQYYNETFKQD